MSSKKFWCKTYILFLQKCRKITAQFIKAQKNGLQILNDKVPLYSHLHFTPRNFQQKKISTLIMHIILIVYYIFLCTVIMRNY